MIMYVIVWKWNVSCRFMSWRLSQELVVIGLEVAETLIIVYYYLEEVTGSAFSMGVLSRGPSLTFTFFLLSGNYELNLLLHSLLSPCQSVQSRSKEKETVKHGLELWSNDPKQTFLPNLSSLSLAILSQWWKIKHSAWKHSVECLEQFRAIHFLFSLLLATIHWKYMMILMLPNAKTEMWWKTLVEL